MTTAIRTVSYKEPFEQSINFSYKQVQFESTRSLANSNKMLTLHRKANIPKVIQSRSHTNRFSLSLRDCFKVVVLVENALLRKKERQLWVCSVFKKEKGDEQLIRRKETLGLCQTQNKFLKLVENDLTVKGFC